MKEVNDTEDSLIITSNEVSLVHSDENFTNKEDKKKIKDFEEPVLFSNEVENSKVELAVAKYSPSEELEIIKNKETGNDITKLESEIDKSELIVPQNDIKTEDNENTAAKKLVLRPRKCDVNQTSENCKTKFSKNGSKKSEKKNAISVEEENIYSLKETFIVNKTDTNLKTDCSIEAEDLEVEKNNIFNKKDIVFECVQDSTSFPENDKNNTYESIPLSDELDSSISKIPDLNQCETKVSLELDISTNKISNKRKRKKDIRWTKKRKRNEGQMSVPFTFGFKFNEKTCSVNNINTNSKRKCNEKTETSQKKSKEYAVPSPSLADISVKAAIPESTAASSEFAKLSLCLCRKKPQVFISGNNNAGDLYCQALDCIDSRIIGCCNPIPSQDVGLFRASERASYQMMCDVHQQRLTRHNCCPGCGLFCTQGKYLMCKFLHHFHKSCAFENENNVILCPHCGDCSPPRTINISIHSSKDPVFLPHQKPIRNMKSAKMSITRESTQFTEDSIFQFPASLLSVSGPENSSINGLSQILHRDKLAHLLNIACRSFSKVCCSNRYSYKSLFNASQSGDVEKLLKIIASGLNPNHIFEESNNQTALHIAAANGNLPIVHILLQAKAQINVLDGEQNTPLTTAIGAKHNDVVKYLIKCGADLTLKSEDGMTPLHIAAKSGNTGACYLLLRGTHLPPKYIDSLDDGGWTPMVWASEFNHLEVVKFLMTQGADPLIKDAEQNIALHWAAFGGSIDIVELYLNHGSDINAVNVHGDTPLHIAARQDKYSCVLLLLARGAKSDVKNKNGELPRDCSESPGSDIYKSITLNMEIGALLTRFQDRTPKIISNDISKGKERNQIQCINGVDDEEEPHDYIYVSENCFTSKISIDRTINSLQSCKCQDNCGLFSCNCSTISIKCWYDNDGRLVPDFNYTDPPMIFECNQACQCNKITCRNRVVQNGISCRFQLFRTDGKGWGIKTLNLIPKGTYVCEYIGEIISDCEADHREDDSYLFDLDNRDGETYCIDARHYGNFARFINHMCVPNLMPVHVFVDHQDLRFPRIAFFAKRDILPNEELGYNYGEKFWVIKWKSFTCTCGAESCIYSENTIQTTLENYRKKIEENP